MCHKLNVGCHIFRKALKDIEFFFLALITHIDYLEKY